MPAGEEPYFAVRLPSRDRAEKPAEQAQAYDELLRRDPPLLRLPPAAS